MGGEKTTKKRENFSFFWEISEKSEFWIRAQVMGRAAKRKLEIVNIFILKEHP